MRNLKKVLSLALALVMLVGMMVIGAGAVETKFVDDGKIGDDYKEAVAVLSAIGVLNGKDAEGNFDPQGTLTRAEAAAILVRMTMGTDAAKGLANVTSSGVFTDMADHWAAGYVDACYNQGIVKGMAVGIYGPNSTLTGTQFAAMLLRAIGVEGDFTGNAWQAAVIAAANKAGLSEVTIGNISRESAAKMGLDGMIYTDEAQETGRYIINFTGDNEDPKGLDGIVCASRSEAAILMSLAEATASNYTVNPETDDSGSLLKEVFGVTRNNNNADAFGNPTRTYSNSDGTLVTVPKGATLTYNEAVTYSKVYNDLGLSKSTKANYSVDGASTTEITLARSNTSDKVGDAGATTNVYKNGNTISIITVKNYLARVTRVTPAKAATATADAVDASVTLTVRKAGASGADLTGKTFKTEEYERGDYVVVTVDKGDDNAVKSIAPVDAVDGVITAYNSSSITLDGERYPLASTCCGVDAASIGFDATWTYFVCNGAILGGEPKTASASTDYVYVVSTQTQKGTNSLLSSSSDAAKAEVVFTDGTHGVIDLAVVKGTGANSSKNGFNKPVSTGTVAWAEITTTELSSSAVGNWFAYTENNEVYTLQALNSNYAAVVTNPTGLTQGVPATFGTKHTNSATEVTKIGDSTRNYAVAKSTGLVSATLTGKVLYTYARNSNVVTAVYAVQQTDVTVGTANYAYALAKGASVKGGTQWTFAIDGEAQTKVVSGTQPTVGGVYTLADAANNTVTVTAVSSNLTSVVRVTGAEDNFFFANSKTYLVDNNTQIYNVSGDAKGEPTDVAVDDCVIVLHSSDVNKKALIVWVVDPVDAPVTGETEDVTEDKTYNDAVSGKVNASGDADLTLNGGVAEGGTVNVNNTGNTAVNGDVAGAVTAGTDTNVTVTGDVTASGTVTAKAGSTVSISGGVGVGGDGMAPKASVVVDGGNVTIEGTIEAGAVKVTAGALTVTEAPVAGAITVGEVTAPVEININVPEETAVDVKAIVLHVTVAHEVVIKINGSIAGSASPAALFMAREVSGFTIPANVKVIVEGDVNAGAAIVIEDGGELTVNGEVKAGAQITTKSQTGFKVGANAVVNEAITLALDTTSSVELTKLTQHIVYKVSDDAAENYNWPDDVDENTVLVVIKTGAKPDAEGQNTGYYKAYTVADGSQNKIFENDGKNIHVGSLGIICYYYSLTKPTDGNGGPAEDALVEGTHYTVHITAGTGKNYTCGFTAWAGTPSAES